MYSCFLGVQQKKEPSSGGTLTNANNGLSVAPDGVTAQLGGTDAVPSPLLNNRRINLTTNFHLEIVSALTEAFFNGSNAAPFFDIQMDMVSRPNSPAMRSYGSTGGRLFNLITTVDSGVNSSADLDIVTGFFEDEGIRIGAFGDGHATDPSVSFINSKGSAEMRIATGAGNIYNAFISFGIEDIEKMRLDPDGSLLIGLDTSHNSLWKLQVQGEAGGYCALFEAANTAAIGIRSYHGTGQAFIGVQTDVANPDLIFSDNSLNELARVSAVNYGLTVPYWDGAAAFSGYSFHNTPASSGGVYADANSIYLVSPNDVGQTQGTINFGQRAGTGNQQFGQMGYDAGNNLNKFFFNGYFETLDSLGIMPNGNASLVAFGSVVNSGGGAVLDVNHYMEFTQGGNLYKIALIV